METKVLVVDDELSMQEFLAILLEREGYTVETADSAESAMLLLDGKSYDLVISDVSMPGLSGIDLLEKIKQQSPGTAVLLMTAFSTAEQAVEAMKLGAYDYIAKPFRVEEIKVLVHNALEKRDLLQENVRLRKQLRERQEFSGLIGKSDAMQQVYNLIDKVAASMVNVLILGESGTGKELAARAIHMKSARRDKPFVAVNCGAIPDTLIESELFGHKKGSFTGAIADRSGLFEQANGGTLFLDEISEIPIQLQTRLLRVIQEREVRRIGGAQDSKVDVRIIAASNRDLEEQVREGSFREDLFYRLNVFSFRMPALRDRSDDIPLLVEHFYHKCRGESTGEVIEPGALRVLMDHSFPGNVRELENLVERCLVLDPVITEENLPPRLTSAFRVDMPAWDGKLPEEGLDLEAYLDTVEKGLILQALEMCGGVKKKAAEKLGLTFRSFRYRLAKFGMDDENN